MRTDLRLEREEDLLVAGTNTIAVEVHQAGASSSDLVFDPALTLESQRATAAATATRGDDIAAARAACRPRPGGTGTTAGTWGPRGAGSCDRLGLRRGPLGYGESYLRTTVSYGAVITTYFTRAFSVNDPRRCLDPRRGDVRRRLRRLPERRRDRRAAMPVGHDHRVDPVDRPRGEQRVRDLRLDRRAAR